MKRKGISLLLMFAGCASAAAQVYISEIVVNPPGVNRGGEVVEFLAPPGFSFAGYRMAQIDGEGSSRGVVRMLIDLSPFSAGANGLLVVRINPGEAPLNPPPAAETSVVAVTTPAGVDFSNGAVTFVLGSGPFPVALGGDLDLNNDGVIDVPLTGFTPVDAVSYLDGQLAALPQAEYAAQLGGIQLGVTLGGNGLPFVPDALTRVLECDEDVPTARIPGGWAGGDITGAPGVGPYFWAAVRTFGFAEAGILDAHLRRLTIGRPAERYCPGACCLFDGVCVQQTQQTCNALKGEYLGDGTFCPPTPTPPTLAETLPEPGSEFGDEFCLEKIIERGTIEQSVTLAAIGGGGDVLRWYRDGCGTGEPIGTGSPLTIDLPQETTTYYARWETICGAVTECAEVTVVIRRGPPIVRIVQPDNGPPFLSLTACPGDALLLQTSVEDATQIVWQFFPPEKGAPLTLPEVGETLPLGPLTAADFGTYQLVARNECGEASATFVVVRGEPPGIKTEPTPFTMLCAGGEFIVSIVALSADVDGALFEWRRDGDPTVLATGSTLQLQNVQPGDSGSYRCTVTDGCGSVESAPAVLAVDDQPPQIGKPETPVNRCADDLADLVLAPVILNGRTFEWRAPGGAIIGTEATLTVAAVDVVAGDYALTVTNGCGTADTTVTVNIDEEAPTIEPVAEVNRCASNEADLVLTPVILNGRTFEWRAPGGAIIGTEASLTVAAADVVAGEFALTVTNGCGTADTTVTVNIDEEAPTIEPLAAVNRCASNETDLVLTPVILNGRTFEWRAPGGAIIGTEASLTVAAADVVAGEYALTVTSGCGEAGITVLVNVDEAAPEISPLASLARCDTDESDLVISPTVIGGRTFEWRNPGGLLVGTDATLTLPAAEVAAGDYTLTVGNGCDPNGVTASVTVFIDTTPPTIDSFSNSPLEVLEGADASFQVRATGGRRFALLLDGVELEALDTTGPEVTFVRTAVPLSAAGLYTLRVSNGCDPAAEATVELIVIPSRVDCVIGTDDVGNSDGRRGPKPDFAPVDFNDIDCFVAALVSQESWDACGTGFTTASYICANDLNCDGVVDFNDIGRFVDCLVAGRCSAGVAPSIATQPPQAVHVVAGADAQLSLTPDAATPPFVIRWQRFDTAGGDFVDLPLSNPSAGQSTLILPAATAADAGEYRAAVRDGCGKPLFSDVVVLVIECETCLPGDSNGSGNISFDDIDCFAASQVSQQIWENCGPIRTPGLTARTQYVCANDVNRDGFVNFDDIEAFTLAVLSDPCAQSLPR